MLPVALKNNRLPVDIWGSSAKLRTSSMRLPGLQDTALPKGPTMKKAVATIAALAVVAVIAVPALGSGASAASAAHLVGVFPNQGSNSNGGYLLYSDGKVVPVGGAPYYGNGLSAKVSNFVALVSDPLDPGYWLITSTGKIVSVGGLCGSGETLQGHRVAGTIVGAANPTGSDDEGFDEVNSAGATSEFQCNFNF